MITYTSDWYPLFTNCCVSIMGWYYAPLSRDYYPLTGKFWEWLRMTRSWLGSNNPFASSSSPSLYLVFKVPSWRGTFHSFWLPLSLQLAQAPSWSWNPKTWSFPVPAEELLFFFPGEMSGGRGTQTNPSPVISPHLKCSNWSKRLGWALVNIWLMGEFSAIPQGYMHDHMYIYMYVRIYYIV